MARNRTKYRYNPETLSFDKIERSIGAIIRTIVVHLFSSTFLGFVIAFLVWWFIDSPEEKLLKTDNKRLSIELEQANKKIDRLSEIMSDLQQRDNNLYRVMLMADSIPNASRHISVSSIDYDLATTYTDKLIAQTNHKITDLEKQIYTQSKSYNELVDLIKNNEDKLKHIPAIQPVLNKDLTRVASGYGWRSDPVYHTRRFHNGMDFTAPTGTDVRATGDGKVIFTGWRQGYGNTIIIDHGYGYETLYAHLSKILVRDGQKVTRADVIGRVGNTGKSTGPHLHYEVFYKGDHVNPMNYYFVDLTPEEYDKMVQLAENAGQVLD